MSDVQQQDFDMIHAKLSQWREDPGVEGFACILIARRTKEDRDKSLNVAVNFHGLWSQRAMSRALKGASELIFNEMRKQDAEQRRAQ